jgi:hypothetical protein
MQKGGFMTYVGFLGFNPMEVEAAESFAAREPVPVGRYPVVATSATRRTNKQGDGWFMEVIFAVAAGEYEGRTVVHRFNLANPSDEAVAIGRSQMRRYLDCIGNLEPKHEGDLCGTGVFITVSCRKDSYVNRKGEKAVGTSNEITRIDPRKEQSDEPAPF